MTSSKKYKKNAKASRKRKLKKGIASSLDINICNTIMLLAIIIIMIYDNISTNNKISQMNDKLISYNEQIILDEIAPHYVFLGDSITKQFELSEYFNGYSVINSGQDGNQTQDILSNMEERVYQYNPSTVFLMIGTNDVNANKSVEYIFDNIKKIVEEIQINLPNTRIIVQSITPSKENWGEYDKNTTRKEVNQLLKNEYKDSDIIYIDVYSMLEDEDTKMLENQYTDDGLHLNDKSYKLIAKELKKYMNMKYRSTK